VVKCILNRKFAAGKPPDRRVCKECDLRVYCYNEKGKATIIPDTEIQIERALGVPASFWNNLERNFQETLARMREEVIPFSSMNYMKNHLRFREE